MIYYKDGENTITLVRKLDFLPKLPQNLIDEAMKLALDEQNAVPSKGELYKELSQNTWFRQIKDLDGSIVKGRPNIKFPLNDEFNEWVRNNVCKTHDGAFVNVTYQNEEGNGTTNPIHTDMSRDWVLVYLLEKSNDDQYTKFWKENGHSAERPRSTFLNDWDNCTEIGEVCYEVGTWYLMKTTVLHSIHNIKGDRRGRISIQVKVDDPLVPGYFIGE